jgi:hypothetical protein
VEHVGQDRFPDRLPAHAMRRAAQCAVARSQSEDSKLVGPTKAVVGRLSLL